jgi:hypothetical protein
MNAVHHGARFYPCRAWKTFMENHLAGSPGRPQARSARKKPASRDLSVDEPLPQDASQITRRDRHGLRRTLAARGFRPDSPEIIRRHYLGFATKPEAAIFFGLRP